MLNVLIAENDRLIADLLQEILEADGYRVAGTARTGKEAVQSAEQLHPRCRDRRYRLGKRRSRNAF
jgi:CheY-like chemotaxis protein